MIRVRLKKYVPANENEGRDALFLLGLMVFLVLFAMTTAMGFMKARKAGSRVETAWAVLDAAMSRKADIFCMLIDEPQVAVSGAAIAAAGACDDFAPEPEARPRLMAARRLELASREVYSLLRALDSIPPHSRTARFLAHLGALEDRVQVAALVYDIEVRRLGDKGSKYGRFWVGVSGAGDLEPFGLKSGLAAGKRDGP